jgi:hypothetical protein
MFAIFSQLNHIEHDNTYETTVSSDFNNLSMTSLETSHSSSQQRKIAAIQSEHHSHYEVESFVVPLELEQNILSTSSFPSLDDNIKQLLALGMCVLYKIRYSFFLFFQTIQTKC